MSDLIRREDAIEILSERAESLRGMQGDLGGACRGAMRIIESLPSAEPERIIRCKDCTFYDPAHVEKDGRRYEYSDLPKEAFVGPSGKLSNIVTAKYGVNFGGICTFDKGTIGDHSVFRSENDFCSKAIERDDDEDA